MLSEMPRKKSDYAPGENPRSQENLQPRETLYKEAKKRRVIMATDEGWGGFKQGAKDMSLSASELVERVGRGFAESDSDREVLFTFQDGQGTRYTCKRVAEN